MRHPRPLRLATLVATLAALLALPGCGDDGSSPEVVSEVRLDAPALELRVGGTRRLAATTVGRGGSVLAGRPVEWSSTDRAVATVSATGDVTGVAPGTARVTASSGGRSAQLAVTVTLVPVTSVTLEVGELLLLPGQARSVAVMVIDSAGRPAASRSVGWRSSDVAVATVSGGGEVRAVAPGTALVIAAVEGREDSVAVTVQGPTGTTVTTPFASLTLAPALAWRVVTTVRDQVGAVMPDAPRTHVSSDPQVVTVSADGIATGVRAGSATITATSGTASLVVPVVVLPGVTRAAGRLVRVGDAVPAAARVAVHVGASGQEFGTAAASDGSFALEAPVPSAALDSATLLVDAAGTTRTHRPILERVHGAAVAARLERPLLVPRQVQVASGTHAGATHAVSLDDAFTRVCASFSDPNCASFYPPYWLSTGVVLWAEGQLTIPVVLHQAGSSQPIASGDSAALWATLRQMEADIGRPLFRSVGVADAPPIDAGGFSHGAIVVTVDGSLNPGSGYANWRWDGNLDMLAAKVRVGSSAALRSSGLVSHEFLHALGFHHSCRWPTVMGGYGCPIAPRITAQDAAAFALAYEVRRTVLASAPTTGLRGALQGEREIELRLPAAAIRSTDAWPALRSAIGGPVYESGAP